MKVKYGTYEHTDNECTVAIDEQVVENDAGQPFLVRKTWDITGVLHGTDTADVVANLRALEAAYAVWFRDLTLTADDGTTVCHSLRNAGSLTGVRILRRPSYPKGDGAELSTFRNYAVRATADYPFTLNSKALRSFTETLTITGGGPQRAVVECVNAPPQEQLIKLFTACRAVQSGSAVGFYEYPLVPPPIFPGKEETVSVPPGNQVRGSPKLANGVYTDFPVSWSYQFISATPLVGFPHYWPAG